MTATTELQNSASGVEASELKRRYVRAAVYSGLLGSVSQILYGLAPVAIARCLNPAEYGVYSVVMSLAAIVTGVFGLGQNSPLHKLVPQFYASDRRLGGAILVNVLVWTSGLLAVFCGVFFLASGWVAEQLYRDVSLSGAFRFCALLMLALTLFTLAASAIAGLQDFRSYNLIQLARNFLLLVFAWSGVWWIGLRGALAGQLLASLFGLALVAFSGVRLARERFPEGVQPVFSIRILGVIVSFVLPTLLLTLLNLPIYWWASTMLARHAGFDQVGLLGVAYTLSQTTFLIPMNLYAPAMTFMSEARASSQPEVFGAMVNANLRAMWTFSMPLALAVGLFSESLIGALFGQAYLAAAPLALALSFTALLMLLVGLMNTAIVASGRMWHNVAITSGWAAIFIAAGLICIPRWAAAGCVAIFAASYALYLIGVCAYSRLAMNVRFVGVARLVTLTAISFSLSAIIFFRLRGASAHIASASLLIGVIVTEWFWIFDRNERERLGRIAAGVFKHISHKQLHRSSTWIRKMSSLISSGAAGRRSC